ncbi:MAG: hypothetical protein MUE81_14570 [Thermoflexibacter sp.]|nr:hypothetical protein [Thermoflexibacter sp.]
MEEKQEKIATTKTFIPQTLTIFQQIKKYQKVAVVVIAILVITIAVSYNIDKLFSTSDITLDSLQFQKEKTNIYLEELISKNTIRRKQLDENIKNFEGAKQELDRMKAEKAVIDRILQEQTQLQDSLSISLNKTTELSQQLITAQQRLNSQEAEIARLRNSMKAMEFRAYYVISRLGNDRVVLLDDKKLMKHKNGDIEKMFVEFRINDVFFDDGQDKKFELTLYRNGQPYKLIREPIIVGSPKLKTMFYMFDGKNKLEAGSYFLRLSYGDERVIPDYRFLIE